MTWSALAIYVSPTFKELVMLPDTLKMGREVGPPFLLFAVTQTQMSG